MNEGVILPKYNYNYLNLGWEVQTSFLRLISFDIFIELTRHYIRTTYSRDNAVYFITILATTLR